MKDKYRISEVEELLGVPRSTIRFYVKKGLVPVEKDEENGYYYYSLKNIRELSHLLVGRNRLNLNLKDSQQRTIMSTLDNYHSVIFRQEQAFLKTIAETRRSLDVLSIYEQMFYRIKRGLGKTSLLPESTFYFFPQFYVFNSKTSVIDVGFPTAVFMKEKQHAVFDGYVSMVYKRDFHLLSDEDAAKVQYTLENTCFVRTVIKTDRDFDDPKLLSSALNWAKRNSVSVKPPFYISYLTELVDAGEKFFYYEVFLPVKDREPS
ncbi:MAG TPA: MerR family transcriptional regulator [Clostridiales bacterium]|nr:MerR family transcriptional regulator [Clostridiales bacterium]